MSIRAGKKRQRGSGMVETALVLTTFTFMLIGALDFGQFLFVHQALVERARKSARWGLVTDPNNTTAIQNMVLYNQSTAPDDGSGYLGLTSSMVQVSHPGTGTADFRLVVHITGYRYTLLSPTIGGTYTGPDITIVDPIGQ